MFNGLRPTAAREVVGVTCWFSAYESARDVFFRNNQGNPPHSWQIAVCGGCGGLGFWGVAFPLDTVKSRLQTQDPRHTNAYRGLTDAFCRIVREEGVRALYRGYNTALIRALCTGGSVFFAYELSRKALG
jgi:solute carrier family 25 carnitine/acylcarnitine transporter 20/29